MDILHESNYTTSVLSEGDGKEKKLYVEGIFMQAEVVNRNKRIYPISVMEEAVQSFREDFMARNMAAAELQHPNSLEINPERIAARITEINQDGNNFYGKALIVDTPMGRIAKGLIEGGFTLGMSTRAAGKVKQNSYGIAEVQEGLRYVAIDLVTSPSSPDAYVHGIMESNSPLWNTIEEYADANLIEDYKKNMQKMSVSQLNENKYALYQQFINTLTGKV